MPFVKRISLFLFFITSLNSYAQLTLGVDASIGSNIATVQDDNGTPFAENNSADGFTEKEGNTAYYALKLNALYAINEKWSARSGLWLNREAYFIQNRDGDFVGVSIYSTTNIELPLLAEYKFADVIGDLDINAYGGFGINFKISENLIKGFGRNGVGDIDLNKNDLNDDEDGAHFWNLANNFTSNDPTRGQNGSNSAQDLFGTVDLGLILGANVEYDLQENLSLVGGLGFNFGLTEEVNGDLQHRDGSPVSAAQSSIWRRNIFALDLGIRYDL